MTPRPTHSTCTPTGVRIAALVLGLGATACDRESAPPEAPAPRVTVDAPARAGVSMTAPRALTTRDGRYHVTWQAAAGFVPVNEHFELDVTVARADATRAPVTGATVEVDCQMPDHGHGMLREPRATEVGGGAYRVRGMLLHMGGHWTVALTVLEGGVASTADDAIDL